MAVGDDSFISDEEEEYCPLCVEEMDISDKNFKPCPCGYQICQFCYNNIRSNPELNGRCPGCRRLYDDESVEYKSISPDEFKLQQMKKEKKEREKRQREKERKENEMANKKHLAGLRVVQKNLVYVTGLNPPCPPEDLHSVLRSDKYFGQYGKISKIVINRKTPNPSSAHHHHQNPGLAVYVTFARKEDALKCINELDGSMCDGRILRAAHGTTKYCSSYLRGHPCPNPNCMFLHEPGEEADSYTRKDLSTQQGIKMGMMGLSGSRVNSINASSTAHSSLNGQEHDHSEEEDNVNSSQQTSNILPATAHWGRSSSASNSPANNNNTSLTNAAAFPTLGEIFREQKQQKRDIKQKKLNKSSKDGASASDESDVDDDSAIRFMDETTEVLKSLSDRGDKLKVHFKELEDDTAHATLPLFAFNPSTKYTSNASHDDEKIIARQAIERFILKPLKNYQLAYQNHPFLQQRTLLKQQAQMQRQQEVQNAQIAQLQQLQLNQKRMLESQQQGPKANAAVSNAALQQQQQLLLLQQLQEQQQQQQQQQQQHFEKQGQQDQQEQQEQKDMQHKDFQNQQSQASLNMLRMREKDGNSVAPPPPPPPGLFSNAENSKVSMRNLSGPSPTLNTASGPQSLNQGMPPNPSSSAQLLTQLMSGKR